MTIGDWIASKRTSKGLTLKQLAEMSDVSLSYLSDMERNVYTNPSYKIMQKVCNALGYTPQTALRQIKE